MRACARACAPTRASINHLLLIIKKISSFVVVVVVIKSLLERFYMCVCVLLAKRNTLALIRLIEFQPHFNTILRGHLLVTS